MKKKSSGTAHASHVSRPNFEPRLCAYSTASVAALATAAAVGTAGTASAQTIHTITTFSINSGGFSITPPQATAHSVTQVVHFSAATALDTVGFNGKLAAWASGGSAVIRIWDRLGNAPGSFLANKLGSRSAIEHATNLVSANKEFLLANGAQGNFRPVGTNVAVSGYVGFKTNLRGHTYYGWLRVKVTNDGGGTPHTVTLVDTNTPGIYGAFALAGSGITAGEVSAIPEPASVAAGLALFALGAAGVREHRRRKQAAA